MDAFNTQKTQICPNVLASNVARASWNNWTTSKKVDTCKETLQLCLVNVAQTHVFRYRPMRDAFCCRLCLFAKMDKIVLTSPGLSYH